MTPALRERLDLVHHLFEFGRQIMMITGANGSGKSRLLQQIEKEAADGWETLRLQGEGLGSTRRLAIDLGVAMAAEAPSTAQLTAAVRAGLADIEADYRVLACSSTMPMSCQMMFARCY